jgi:hypothetical protein
MVCSRKKLIGHRLGSFLCFWRLLRSSGRHADGLSTVLGNASRPSLLLGRRAKLRAHTVHLPADPREGRGILLVPRANSASLLVAAPAAKPIKAAGSKVVDAATAARQGDQMWDNDRRRHVGRFANIAAGVVECCPLPPALGPAGFLQLSHAPRAPGRKKSAEPRSRKATTQRPKTPSWARSGRGANKRAGEPVPKSLLQDVCPGGAKLINEPRYAVRPTTTGLSNGRPPNRARGRRRRRTTSPAFAASWPKDRGPERTSRKQQQPGGCGCLR